MTHASRHGDSELGIYLGQLPAMPRLTFEEEQQLSTRIRRHQCTASRERLVHGSLRLVVFAAKRFRGYGVPLADLVEAGNLGLLRAADRFDPASGNRFSTYAMWWIKQAICAALAEHGSLVRLPTSQRRVVRSCRKAREQLVAALGREATLDEISLASGLPLSAVRAAKLTAPVISGSGLDDELASGIADSGAHAPSEDASKRELSTRIRGMVDELPPREREIVRLHFGLGGRAPMTVARIGAEVHVPSEQVARLLSRALARLRQSVDGSTADRAA